MAGVATTNASPSTTPSPNRDLIEQGVKTLSFMQENCDLNAMRTLIAFWLAKGINLALADPIVECCAEGIAHLDALPSPGSDWCLLKSQLLFHNSAHPIDCGRITDASGFSDQISGDQVRWETISIFFTAIAQATYDVPFFPPLYTSPTECNKVRKLATKLSDSCLANCLPLDCLNDLQLICQYENFIMNSMTDGDHSQSAHRNFCVGKELTLSRLSCMAKIRRCHLIFICTWLSSKDRRSTWSSTLSSRTETNCLRPHLLGRQECCNSAWPTTSNEQKILFLSDSFMRKRGDC